MDKEHDSYDIIREFKIIMKKKVWMILSKNLMIILKIKKLN